MRKEPEKEPCGEKVEDGEQDEHTGQHPERCSADFGVGGICGVVEDVDMVADGMTWGRRRPGGDGAVGFS